MKPLLARVLPILAVACFVLAPELASACAVCSAGRDEENRFAFLATTIFMSLFPLSIIGGMGLWLRKRARELSGLPVEEDEGSEATRDTRLASYSCARRTRVTTLLDSSSSTC